jgi:hypothetical protein
MNKYECFSHAKSREFYLCFVSLPMAVNSIGGMLKDGRLAMSQERM